MGTLKDSIGASLTVQEEDGSPSVDSTVIKVPNGTLTDNGSGSVSLRLAPGADAFTTLADIEPFRFASWKMEDTSLSNGQTISDEIGSNDLTINGNGFSSLNPGKDGLGITRGTADDDFQRATGLESLEQDFTWNFWFKTSTSIPGDRNLMTIGSTSFFQLTGTKTVRLILNNEPHKNSSSFSGTLNDGSWHMYTVVRRTEGSDTYYRMYVDNEELYNQIDNTTISVSGTFAIGDNGGGSPGITGDLDQFDYWKGDAASGAGAHEDIVEELWDSGTGTFL